MGIKLNYILNKLPVIEVVGNSNKEITGIVSATKNQSGEGDIMWVSEKNAELIKKIHQGIIICQPGSKQYFNTSCTYLLVHNPRLYFLNVIKSFFLENETATISQLSQIDSTVKVGKNVSIGSGVVIEKECEIGDETVIDCNTVIKRRTIIGREVRIGANNTIGGVGFGYEKDESGKFELIPHIGNVVIEDYVEIGNNTAIDRAVLGSTIIRRNAKIDNLVHIAHGVEIGENSLIIANSMIAGSVVIGKNVWVAPSSSVLNKLNVEDNALIGMGAVVVKNVASNQTVVGNPAKDISTIKKSN
jgi:UDP-3-O-[3-hydroxymyristoyl] glucosamine N-acyltransferase